MAGIWVISEQTELILELLGAAQALAGQNGMAITAVFLGNDSLPANLFAYGANEVLTGETQAHWPVEAWVPRLLCEIEAAAPDIILLGGTKRGQEIAARLAAGLDTGLGSDCHSIRWNGENRRMEMDRLMYGGTVTQSMVCTGSPQMAVIGPRVYRPVQPLWDRSGPVRSLIPPAETPVMVLERLPKGNKAGELHDAETVVCAGRGFLACEDLDLIRSLAEAVGGQVAATRPLTEDLGWLPGERCIGLSGKQIKPNLYIGVGVSGQIQHMIGVRDSRVIVAVNSDENAPIFGVSDFGVVGDLYSVIPRFVKALKDIATG